MLSVLQSLIGVSGSAIGVLKKSPFVVGVSIASFCLALFGLAGSISLNKGLIGAHGIVTISWLASTFLY